MENHILIIFKKQSWEKINSYSLVSEELLKTIPVSLILDKADLEKISYSKEELEAERDKLIKKHEQS